MSSKNLPLSPGKGFGLLTGFALGAVLTAGVFWTSRMFHLGHPVIIFIGAFQWIYVLPLVRILRGKQQARTAKGLLVAAWLVVAANAAGWALFIWLLH